jgi:pyruvate formate lyase activating enzyme
MYKLTSLPSTSESVLEQARDIAMKAGMNYVYVGNIAGSEGQNTYCPSCKKMIVERRGHTVYSNLIKAGKCGLCGTSIPGVW